MWVVVNVLIFITLGLLVYLLISLIKNEELKKKFCQTKVYNKLDEYMVLSAKRKLIPRNVNISSPVILILIMLIMFVTSFTVFYFYLKIFSTSIILSLPFFISPILVIKVLLNKEKSDIIKQLPFYVVNIKNHIDSDNNIIAAIQRTSVEQPLKKYIDFFKTNVSRGMNVMEAFDILKQDVKVKVFTDFINSCEVCFLNGGDFNGVLEQYINMITKENVHKETMREKAYADILTLIIMVILNVLVIVLFVFTNKEYAEIMRVTVWGKLILNFNALSYILIAYLISKIYKEE